MVSTLVSVKQTVYDDMIGPYAIQYVNAELYMKVYTYIELELLAVDCIYSIIRDSTQFDSI